MFNSGIKADNLINELNEEAVISPAIEDEKYVSWINALEQMLYSDIIKEQKQKDCKITFTPTDSRHAIELSEFNGAEEDEVRFEDIIAVFYGEKQLIKTTLTSSYIFKDCYFKLSDKLYIDASDNLKDDEQSKEVEVYVSYIVRPALKSKNSLSSDIMLPAEFIDLMKSYLRAEAYKIANEDELCAKWTNEYNVLLESFKIWIASRQPSFGI